MSLPRSKEHWFSFNSSCVSLTEWRPPLADTQKQPHSLFFIHGSFGDMEIWSSIIEGLAGQFRCLTVDLPGFGRSFSVGKHTPSLLERVTLVKELVCQFTSLTEKVILVGHDVGGGIAQLCALNIPEK